MDMEHLKNMGFGQESSFKCIGGKDQPGFKKWKDLFKEGYEVAEMVLGLIDIESFLACRLVCRDWRSAVNTFQPKWREVKGTSLIKAVKSNQELVAELLIAKGADVLARESDVGSTALHWAAWNGLTSTTESVMSKGAMLEANDEDLLTPLHFASLQGHLPIVKMLIAHCANIEAEDEEGMTPLANAVDACKESVVVELIIEGANVHVRDKCGICPIHLASQNADPSIANILKANGANIHVRDDDGWTPLIHACRYGSPEVAQLLISFGADVNVTDHDEGQTPLFYVCKRNSTPADYWVKQLITLLVSHGVNVNARNFDQKTPLHIAASAGSTVAVQSLISYGADIHIEEETRLSWNKWDMHGLLPLHCAADGSYPEVIDLLLFHGADVNKETDENMTALHIISIKDETRKEWRQHQCQRHQEKNTPSLCLYERPLRTR